MKKVFFVSMIAALIIGSCTQEKKSPIEGTWMMVYSSMGGNVRIKTWSKEYYTFVGYSEQIRDSLIIRNDKFGAGTYTLNGNRCEQTTLYHNNTSKIGTKIKVLTEIRNDTLIQIYPADENWKLPRFYDTEKYVRLK